MIRKLLLASTAAVSMALAAPSAALAGTGGDQGGPITEFYGVNGGPIDPFYGSINPFYGSINPFYGHISPFWGNIQPFWGSINPFYGTIQPFYGNIDPFWGTINPFSGPLAKVYPYWNATGPQWGQINDLWNQLQASNATDYSQLQSALNDFASGVHTYLGDQGDHLIAQMLSKYNIDPNSAASLAAVTPEARSAFYVNFYDAAIDLTKLDHVDWWMSSVHWSPQLVQDAGKGNVVAGLLDASITQNYSDVGDLKFIGGFQGYVNDHGAATASLAAARKDNLGVMGIAPNAKVRLYNPFDATGTASWHDVDAGIYTLYLQHVTVMNASLGIPKWVLSRGWVPVLTSPHLHDNQHYFVLVKAAGNEGVQQRGSVTLPAGYSAPNNLIMVGSVGPSGDISQFSNTPGEACIVVDGACQEQNKLKYRYMVAPGELMLVEDNHGGTTRMTGTSFAAPLVTGTVALMQARWPWLQQYADETVQIVLQSATDLGAPGVDPVYGWGELNVEGAMSPLNFDNLIVFKPFAKVPNAVTDKNSPNWTPADLRAAINAPGQLDAWNKQQAFLVAYENDGTTYRDFLVPLSSALIGKPQKVNGITETFQSYIYQRLLNWAHATPHRPPHGPHKNTRH
jgi:hypothetical protein